MRILVVSPRFPHAAVRSGLAIVYQRIRRLVARGHEVGLISFITEEDRPHLEAMREGLFALETMPGPPPAPAWTRAWRAWRTPPPFDYARGTPMARRIGDMVERDEYQVVLVEFSEMAPCLVGNPWLPAVRTVMSCHRCATIASQKRCDVLGYSLAGLWERWRRDRLLRYEFPVYRQMDHVLVLSPQERWQMLHYAPDLRITVIPYGVDVATFCPPEIETQRQGLLFTGYYSDEQNRDAVLWFLQHVWPRIVARRPETTFHVVGPDPTPAMRAMGEMDPRVRVTNRVPDVLPYLHRAAVFVCPVRMGSGMRGKILEAMAAGTPVVTTSVGAEGIPAVPGENCFLADDPVVMANHIEWLLADEALRRRLAENARRVVAERFSWDYTISRLEETLERVLDY